MGISVCAFSAKAAPRKHQARISRPMHVGRFTQEPAETCPLTHSPRVLSIGPAASTVVRISRAPRSVHDCRPGQSDWLTSETGSVVIGSAPARSAAVRDSDQFLNRPGGRFFSKQISCVGGADVLNIHGKPNRIYCEPLCAVLVQLHLAGRLDPCNQPQEPL